MWGSLLGKLLSLLVVLVITFYTGCAGNSHIRRVDDVKTYSPEPNGYVTDAHPAVGILNINMQRACTIVLIRPRIALTASHCVDEWSDDLPFYAYTAQWGTSTYLISSVKAFPGVDLVGRTDIALVILDAPVAKIRPLSVAALYPPANSLAVFVGHGCSPFGDVGDHIAVYPRGTKREIEFRINGVLVYDQLYSNTLRLCPGDSGGALINVKDNTLIGIASAMGFSKENGRVRYRYSMFADPILFTAFIRYAELLQGFKEFIPIAGLLS